MIMVRMKASHPILVTRALSDVAPKVPCRPPHYFELRAKARRATPVRWQLSPESKTVSAVVFKKLLLTRHSRSHGHLTIEYTDRHSTQMLRANSRAILLLVHRFVYFH